ncbi:hypothetical protein EVAR_44559_1 [Eumeta japonica]|uniref:Uncharacterized protein n=1 Tax=Eumeta variegata TaxID=151549 RepID=A0A4C1X9Q3_EUMVA|nr:hypothetical protein EVAR_44559_1 [Eumeta japonica]
MLRHFVSAAGRGRLIVGTRPRACAYGCTASAATTRRRRGRNGSCVAPSVESGLEPHGKKIACNVEEILHFVHPLRGVDLAVLYDSCGVGRNRVKINTGALSPRHRLCARTATRYELYN